MIWIRGPAWDGFWVLSGLPIALFTVVAVYCCGVEYAWIYLPLLVTFHLGHSISPIAMTWANAGFRRHMLTRRYKFVVMPVGVGIALVSIGWLSSKYFGPVWFNTATFKIDVVSNFHASPFLHPMWTIGMFYALWNIFHFGMQNFGVMSLYRGKAGWYGSGQRRADLVYSCGAAWSTMGVSFLHVVANYLRWPILGWRPVAGAYLVVAVAGMLFMLWRERHRLCLPRVWLIVTAGVGMGTAMLWPITALGIVSMNHWLAAIGLSSLGSGRPKLAFCPLVIAGAAVFYCGVFIYFNNLIIATSFAGAIVGLRLALAHAHFQYDGSAYKFSDPVVRATIGAFFCARAWAAPTPIIGR